MIVGCRYAGRCPFALESCRTAAPPLRQAADPGHSLSCWLQEEMQK